ncbi:MAG: pyrimidine dimer DNA glycosylase/endonuclease V [Candidatus Bathyarchaeia archaeon]|nr:hypothetical protein [Candidatus Bathyarchaeota archaeon]
MRLWSLHPMYLDRVGLIALWREGLLAKKVLEGKTKGYKNHPQLARFKKYENPIALINAYLYEVYLEAVKRGYNLDYSKIVPLKLIEVITVTKGQLINEFMHLLQKLKKRDSKKFKEIKKLKFCSLKANPIFRVIEGGIEDWEKTRYL